ncbi:hypothetical protein BAN20980_03305 [Burkholderia anthina]|uniref:Uncharacterized protein n=1 Tax=Burkholderia anthina TaxID=179879 RepID=A0A6P2GBH2_9BURK|nr:hypothetical protein [Burkholderia anthina]MBM2766173.1 hypothetical protein [Burkholderia anthina]VVU50589.1 hypothetical protein BAN20980_03305 [Burkholderia anthina]
MRCVAAGPIDEWNRHVSWQGIAVTNPHLLEMDAILSAPGFFDFLGDVDCDRVLDSRDAEPFDTPWMAAFDEVDGDPGAALDKPAVDVLREKAFRLAFRASGNADIAACVADDIELIARSRLSGRVDGWPIHLLWNAYQNGRFPC